MKRLLLFLLLIPALSFGQQVYTFEGKVLTTGGKVATEVYCDNYQTVYDAFTTTPAKNYSGYWNTMVETIGTYWDSLDVFYFYSVHTNTAGEALINWKLPGTYDATAYNAPTFTAYEGFLGNGTTQYINCNWNPAANGVNYTQNSASQIIYVRNNTTSPTSAAGHGTYGNTDNRDCFINPRRNTNFAYSRVNSYGNITVANDNGSGMWVNSRTAANLTTLYKNNVSKRTSPNVASAPPTHNPYCLAYNDDNVATGFRADQVSCYAFGAGLSQTAVTTITNAIEAAMDAMGKGVIP